MNLTDLRRKKNLRMVDLASRIGISQGHLSRLENGRKHVPADLLEKIAQALGESSDVVAKAARSQNAEVTALHSWLSALRINGLPLARAFAYHVDSRGLREQVIIDDTALRNALRDFIEKNITYSVIAEMAENKALLPTLRTHIAGTTRETKTTTNHEQPTGLK